MSKIPITIILFITLSLMTQCFGGVIRQGSVESYQNQIVKTKGGAFKIGALTYNWAQHKIKYRAILFVNKIDQASITIDSWCQGAYDDGPLKDLTHQLVRGVKNFKISKQQILRLSEREALRTEGVGTVDGQTVFLSATVLKMNQCVFDFVYIALPKPSESYQDYLQMVSEFKYLSGPSVI